MDNEPLPAHRGGDVPEGLRRLVGRPLRQAPGTLGLRRLPVPVPPQMGGETKRRWPELFAEAVEIDARLRNRLALDNTAYLHMLRMPLDEAEMGRGGQADGFGNECEGHYGV